MKIDCFLNLNLQMEKRLTPLKEQLSLVIPILEDMRLEKEERIKQFIDIQAQIDRIHAEITGLPHQNSNVASFSVDEHNLSMLRLNEYQAHLRTLQKDKVITCTLIASVLR